MSRLIKDIAGLAAMTDAEKLGLRCTNEVRALGSRVTFMNMDCIAAVFDQDRHFRNAYSIASPRGHIRDNAPRLCVDLKVHRATAPRPAYLAFFEAQSGHALLCYDFKNQTGESPGLPDVLEKNDTIELEWSFT